MADSSFDIVSKIDRMELDNALNQASREVTTRFDFKDTGVKIEMSGERILVEAETEERSKAALEVLKEKMIKRGVSLKHLEIKDPEQSGKFFKIFCPIKEGISSENAKKITKLLKEEGPKSVKAQIQGDAVRVTSKSKDDLQEVIALVKGAKLDFAVQFTNYR
ncbi:MAG: YajQ family cyclic di-GMP-binding protein [Candidatus Nanopelagicaceae bacterium]